MSEHLAKRRIERALRERGAGKDRAVIAVSKVWPRFGFLHRIAPFLLVVLAEREIARRG